MFFDEELLRLTLARLEWLLEKEELGPAACASAIAGFMRQSEEERSMTLARGLVSRFLQQLQDGDVMSCGTVLKGVAAIKLADPVLVWPLV